MENKEDNFEIQVLTRLAVIESKLDDYKKIEDITFIENNSLNNLLSFKLSPITLAISRVPYKGIPKAANKEK